MTVPPDPAAPLSGPQSRPQVAVLLDAALVERILAGERDEWDAADIVSAIGEALESQGCSSAQAVEKSVGFEQACPATCLCYVRHECLRSLYHLGSHTFTWGCRAPGDNAKVLGGIVPIARSEYEGQFPHEDVRCQHTNGSLQCVRIEGHTGPHNDGGLR